MSGLQAFSQMNPDDEQFSCEQGEFRGTDGKSLSGVQGGGFGFPWVVHVSENHYSIVSSNLLTHSLRDRSPSMGRIMGLLLLAGAIKIGLTIVSFGIQVPAGIL